MQASKIDDSEKTLGEGAEITGVGGAALTSRDRRRLELGERLVLLRIRRGLSQTEASRKLGIHRPILGSYEAARSEPPLFRASDIAELYGVHIDVLTGRMTMPPPESMRPRRRDQDE